MRNCIEILDKCTKNNHISAFWAKKNVLMANNMIVECIISENIYDMFKCPCEKKNTQDKK